MEIFAKINKIHVWEHMSLFMASPSEYESWILLSQFSETQQTFIVTIKAEVIALGRN